MNDIEFISPQKAYHLKNQQRIAHRPPSLSEGMDRNARRFGFRLERRLRSIKKKDFNRIPHCPHLFSQIHHQPLRAALEKEPTEALIARYEALRTPHNTTDYDTRQRLIRALEIAIYEESHPVTRTAFLPKRTKFIGISVTRDERNARIDRRLDARLQEGLIQEVRGLLDRGLSPEDLLYYGLEYKFVTLYLTGQLGYDEMVERLRIAIHQFAKRQMTWFRGMERRGISIEWI